LRRGRAMNVAPGRFTADGGTEGTYAGRYCLGTGPQ
jgi:hypothetical protein